MQTEVIPTCHFFLALIKWNSKFKVTVMILNVRTDMSGQTVQTQIRLLIGVYTVWVSFCIIWSHFSMVNAHCSNFRIIIAFVWMSEYLGILRYSCFDYRTTEHKDNCTAWENAISYVCVLWIFLWLSCTVSLFSIKYRLSAYYERVLFPWYLHAYDDVKNYFPYDNTTTLLLFLL